MHIINNNVTASASLEGLVKTETVKSGVELVNLQF